MQGLPSKGAKGLLCLGGQVGGLGAEAGSVDIVSHQRMADMRQVHADLMGAAGLEAASKEAGNRFAVGAGVTLQYFPMRNRLPSTFANGPLVARMRMTVDRRIDGAFRPG